MENENTDHISIRLGSAGSDEYVFNWVTFDDKPDATEVWCNKINNKTPVFFAGKNWSREDVVETAKRIAECYRTAIRRGRAEGAESLRESLRDLLHVKKKGG